MWKIDGRCTMNLTSWLSPLHTRGMSIWGSIACIILSYELYHAQGRLIEVWPNRCSLLKSQLLKVSDSLYPSEHPLQVKFSDPSSSPKYWRIEHEEHFWPIPKREYSGARLRFNRMKPIWIELMSDDRPSVTMIYEPDQAVNSLYRLISDMSSGIERTAEFSDTMLMKSKLEDLSYRTVPQDISCDRSYMQTELPKLLSLMLKMTDVGLTRVEYLAEGVWLTRSTISNIEHHQFRKWISQSQQLSGVWSISWTHYEDDRGQRLGEQPPSWLKALLNLLDELQKKPQIHTEILSRLPEQVTVLQ